MKFKCSICGYTYDEAIGLPEEDVAPGTKWKDIPEDFTCPRCGAPKTVFEELKEDTTVSSPTTHEDAHFEELKELSSGELSALCSNLAKGCEKQFLLEERDLFYQLSEYFTNMVVSQKEKSFDDIAKLVGADLSEDYSKAKTITESKADRGALRAIVWSDKVSRIMRSLFDRYASAGEAMLENTKIYVCDICGFVYVGNELPNVCPVCKVPNFKIMEIGRR